MPANNPLAQVLQQHWKTFAESVTWIGVLLTACLWLPDTQLTPLVIFCVLLVSLCAIAVRYQSLVAYSSASVAAVGFAVVLRLHLHQQISYGALEAFFLLASTALVSELTLGQRLRLEQAEQRYQQAQATVDDLMHRHQAALAVNDELERQIAGMPSSLALICDEIAHLSQLHYDDLYNAITRLAAHALAADACSLYLGQDEHLRRVATWPAPATTDHPRLPADDIVVAHALQQKQLCTIHDCLAELASVPSSQALIAGPIFYANGDIMGMLVIDAMPLLKFTPMAIRLCKALLPLIENTLRMQSSQRADVQASGKPHRDLADVIDFSSSDIWRQQWEPVTLPSTLTCDVNE